MSLNKTCPKCGSEKCEIIHVKQGHGCLKFIFLGWLYVFWLAIKWSIGLIVLLLWDWWYAIIMGFLKKDYRWISKSFFVYKKTYYCHDCGNNFKA